VSNVPGTSTTVVPLTPPPGMVLVPGGTFMMGTDDPRSNEGARPAHSISVKPFFLDEHEVTNEQYRQFVEATNHRAPRSWPRGKMPAEIAQLPVVGVTWEDATRFAAQQGKRLPSEAEWEFAARGSESRVYPWGDSWNPSTVSGSLRAVGSNPDDKTVFGAFDMCGNVSEWTASDLVPYPKSTYVIQPEHRYNKMFRGGNFKIAPDKREIGMAAWYRFSKKPDEAEEHLGFRCAQDPPN
jgi:serine/threonine-protein kinase